MAIVATLSCVCCVLAESPLTVQKIQSKARLLRRPLPLPLRKEAVLWKLYRRAPK